MKFTENLLIGNIINPRLVGCSACYVTRCVKNNLTSIEKEVNRRRNANCRGLFLKVERTKKIKKSNLINFRKKILDESLDFENHSTAVRATAQYSIREIFGIFSWKIRHDVSLRKIFNKKSLICFLHKKIYLSYFIYYNQWSFLCL